MKKILAIMLGLLTLAFIFNSPRSTNESVFISPQPNVDEFIFGAIQSYNDQLYNYRNFDSIGLNCMHTYDGQDSFYTGSEFRHSPRTWIGNNDRLFSDYADYQTDVYNAINSAHSHNSSSMIWSRPKIEWLAYGQRSDYQFEPAPLDTGLWFYSFKLINQNL